LHATFPEHNLRRHITPACLRCTRRVSTATRLLYLPTNTIKLAHSWHAVWCAKWLRPRGGRLMPWMSCLNLRSCFGSFFFPLSFSDERHAHPGLSSFFLFFPLGTCKTTRYLVQEKSLGWFLAFIDLPPPTGKRRTAVRALASRVATTCCRLSYYPAVLSDTIPTPLAQPILEIYFLETELLFSLDILRVKSEAKGILEEGPTRGWSWAQGHFW
jgi:hypothetical protein